MFPLQRNNIARFEKFSVLGRLAIEERFFPTGVFHLQSAVRESFEKQSSRAFSRHFPEVKIIRANAIPDAFANNVGGKAFGSFL